VRVGLTQVLLGSGLSPSVGMGGVSVSVSVMIIVCGVRRWMEGGTRLGR
jgi:hypothetical protein